MRAWIGAVAVCAALSAGPRAVAAGGTATDQAVSLVYGPSHWDGTPEADLTGVSLAGDPVFQSGWWYRASGDTHEFPMPAPDSADYVAGTVFATWNNLDGKGFDVYEETSVFDNEGPSGGFVSRLVVVNNNAAARKFYAFHLADLDVAGTSGGDSGQLVTNSFLKFSDGPHGVLYRAWNNEQFQVAEPATLLGLLNDSALTDLDGTGVTFEPGDVAAAFQFQVTLGPSASSTVAQVSLFAGLPRDHVKGDVLGVLSYPALLAQHPTFLSWYYTPLRRTEILSTPVVGSTPFGASIMGVDDFDADLRDEVVSRDLTTGVTYVGFDPIQGAPTLAPNWKLSATGDFNADGRADLVWRNVTSQKLVLWTMNGPTKTGAIIPTPDQAVDSNWEVAGAADFDGDGARDFLWYNQTTGKLVLWYMDASVVRTSGVFTQPASVANNNWRVVAVGDLGKGPAQGGTPELDTQDIVWQNDTSLKIVVWHMDHSAHRTSGVFTNPDTYVAGYRIVGPR